MKKNESIIAIGPTYNLEISQVAFAMSLQIFFLEDDYESSFCCDVLITKRHDEALNLIFIELKKRNPEWTFELEPRPAANVANHKPDLDEMAATLKMTMDDVYSTVTLIEFSLCELTQIMNFGKTAFLASSRCFCTEIG
ncbi:hypothetical protein GQR58_002725 [Nymphon striatum]|nr:hypothetical protein GQR58_002725 [Nymphon striatum]